MPNDVETVQTLVVTAINLHDRESKAIEGLTPFVLFATILMLASAAM